MPIHHYITKSESDMPVTIYGVAFLCRDRPEKARPEICMCIHMCVYIHMYIYIYIYIYTHYIYIYSGDQNSGDRKRPEETRHHMV